MSESLQTYSENAVPPNLVNQDPTTVFFHELLKSIGGIHYLEQLIPGIANLDPSRPARKDIFLNDDSLKESRADLLAQLEVWEEVLSSENYQQAYCIEKAAEQEILLYQNLYKVFDELRPLERSYSNLSLFFKNAGKEQIANISFINCEPQHIREPDFTHFADSIAEELKMHYDRVDLSNNYSLLVLPGYLGPDSVVEKWAKVAYENKVLIITDFENLEDADDVMEVFNMSGHASGDVHKSAVMMCCNWLVARRIYHEIGEKNPLYVPPSGAIAGKMYDLLMSQPAAGPKFGVVEGVEGVKFPLKKSEAAVLERMHLVPMMQQFGKVIACSSKTLFNGNNLGLQVYSVVRVFDYVTKVLMDFLNRRAFENFNANIRKELMGQIVKFLDSISGNGKLVENFSINRFEQDTMQRDKIHLDIHIKPYFPAKNFVIKMEGQQETDGTNWSTVYDS
jgi:hypothetical protein